MNLTHEIAANKSARAVPAEGGAAGGRAVASASS